MEECGTTNYGKCCFTKKTSSACPLPVFPLLPDDLCSDFHKPHGILLNSKGTDIEMCVIGLKLKHLSFKC